MKFHGVGGSQPSGLRPDGAARTGRRGSRLCDGGHCPALCRPPAPPAAGAPSKGLIPPPPGGSTTAAEDSRSREVSHAARASDRGDVSRAGASRGRATTRSNASRFHAPGRPRSGPVAGWRRACPAARGGRTNPLFLCGIIAGGGQGGCPRAERGASGEAGGWAWRGRGPVAQRVGPRGFVRGRCDTGDEITCRKSENPPATSVAHTNLTVVYPSCHSKFMDERGRGIPLVAARNDLQMALQGSRGPKRRSLTGRGL